MSGQVSKGFHTPSWSKSSETSPTPSPSSSIWSGLETSGLLSKISATPSPSVSSVGKAGKDWSSKAFLPPSGTWIFVCVTDIGTSGSPSAVLTYSISTSYILSPLASPGGSKTGGLINSK